MTRPPMAHQPDPRTVLVSIDDVRALFWLIAFAAIFVAITSTQ